MSTTPIVKDEDLNSREVIGVVLRNWRDELVQLAREKFVLFQASEISWITLYIQADTIRISRVHGAVSEDVAQISSDDASDKFRAKELSRAVANFELDKDVVIVLPADSVLRHQLTMPHARRAMLTNALRYELERFSPIDATELYYDFIVGDRELDTGSVELELRIIRKALVDDSVALCRAAGLAVAGIYFNGDGRAADWQTFPIDRYALLRTLVRRFGLAALGALAIFLFVAVLVGAYVRGASTLDALTDAVADAGLQAARVERLQQTIDRTSTDLTLAARQKQSPLFVGALTELTEILPDGTWLTELTMDGSKIRIQGASPSASDLIGLIDHSRQFSNAQFEAPLLHDTTANVDRFDISFGTHGAKP